MFSLTCIITIESTAQIETHRSIQSLHSCYKQMWPHTDLTSASCCVPRRHRIPVACLLNPDGSFERCFFSHQYSEHLFVSLHSIFVTAHFKRYFEINLLRRVPTHWLFGTHRKNKYPTLLCFIYYLKVNICFILKIYWILFTTSVYDSLLMYNIMYIIIIFRKYLSLHARHIMFFCLYLSIYLYLYFIILNRFVA